MTGQSSASVALYAPALSSSSRSPSLLCFLLSCFFSLSVLFFSPSLSAQCALPFSVPFSPPFVRLLCFLLKKLEAPHVHSFFFFLFFSSLVFCLGLAEAFPRFLVRNPTVFPPFSPQFFFPFFFSVFFSVPSLSVSLFCLLPCSRSPPFFFWSPLFSLYRASSSLGGGNSCPPP